MAKSKHTGIYSNRLEDTELIKTGRGWNRIIFLEFSANGVEGLKWKKTLKYTEISL